MTCAHVLGLIDAGSFADYPRAHLDAAWQHARQCARCGRALEAATALTTDLIGLPQPAPPPDLTRTVLARIARIDLTRSNRSAATMPETGASRPPDWSPWATTLGGLGAGLAIVLTMLGGAGAPDDITSPRVGGMNVSLLALPLTTTGALVLAASLGLYVAGLFAPLGGKGSPRSFDYY